MATEERGLEVTPQEDVGKETGRGSVKVEEAVDISLESSTEQLVVLLRREASNYPLCKDYLSSLRECQVDATDRVSEGWRRKLCEWCFEVVDHFNFDREVVSYALDFLDRSVAIKTDLTKAALPKREFQLMAVTSLYTAIKLHGETDAKDGPRRKLRIGAFVELSRGFFEVDVIERSELEILKSLQWRMNPPTSLRFTSTMLRLCPKWTSDEHDISYSHVMGGIFDVARYLTELSVCVSSFAFTCKASVISYASIICALEALKTPIPLPARARAAFFEGMANATGLLPSDPDVTRVVSMLKTLCPTMFLCEELLPDYMVSSESSSYSAQSPSYDDRDSPVCVVDGPGQTGSPCSPRKRSCPSNEDNSRVHRSNYL